MLLFRYMNQTVHCPFSIDLAAFQQQQLYYTILCRDANDIGYILTMMICCICGHDRENVFFIPFILIMMICFFQG
jgi:hypothetical protein